MQCRDRLFKAVMDTIPEKKDDKIKVTRKFYNAILERQHRLNENQLKENKEHLLSKVFKIEEGFIIESDDEPSEENVISMSRSP